MIIVLDASVVVSALTDTGTNGRWAEALIGNSEPVAPELIVVEVTNVLRRLERAGVVSERVANSAHEDLLQLNLELYPYYPLAARIWALRKNLSTYDAWYVSLAEALDCKMATLDRKLIRSSGSDCEFVTP
ncbi:MAG: type II toxin-antitoxin system VapC family toxin [Proteobacteria bacterium]|nr:type II toxin-antitoxin system VapC family toxin [Pseudomonadota bacterium]MDA1300275.1 type II toxin-antitoxin system VapC family toxin [Pseudomonadota bacterium]